jgi:hypothetical protein
MTTWRVARSILTLFGQLQAKAPMARPRPVGQLVADEWGTIGDAAHDPGSDHSPHNFPGWGAQIVTAGDFPNRPDLGLDAHQVLDNIRRSHDPRVKYGISNGQQFSSYPVSGYDAWTWRPYNPKNGDKHFTHGHLSVVGDARADGTQPWAIGAPAGGAHTEDEDDMGASFGPITINASGVTSLTIPPVLAGLADPRPAWLNFCNDTGVPYVLRIWYTTGDKVFSAFPGTDAKGLLKLESGQRWSNEIPAGASCLSISRRTIGADGKPDDSEAGAYGGHLTCAIERGPVKG